MEEYVDLSEEVTRAKLCDMTIRGFIPLMTVPFPEVTIKKRTEMRIVPISRLAPLHQFL